MPIIQIAPPPAHFTGLPDHSALVMVFVCLAIMGLTLLISWAIMLGIRRLYRTLRSRRSKFDDVEAQVQSVSPSVSLIKSEYPQASKTPATGPVLKEVSRFTPSIISSAAPGVSDVDLEAQWPTNTPWSPGSHYVKLPPISHSELDYVGSMAISSPEDVLVNQVDTSLSFGHFFSNKLDEDSSFDYDEENYGAFGEMDDQDAELITFRWIPSIEDLDRSARIISQPPEPLANSKRKSVHADQASNKRVKPANVTVLDDVTNTMPIKWISSGLAITTPRSVISRPIERSTDNQPKGKPRKKIRRDKENRPTSLRAQL